MNTLFKYIILSLLVATPTLSAQIVSTGDMASEDAAYSASDKIFFYPDITSASLSAMPPAGGTNVTYTWEKYDAGTWSEVMTGNSSTFIDLSEGAYRVSVRDNGTLAAQYVCWTFQPQILTVEVDTLYSNCSNMQLSATSTTKALNYVNPANGNPYTVNYQLAYNWKADPTSDITSATTAQPTIESAAEPTTYSVEVSAFNGAHRLTGSYVYSDPKAVKANFTFNVTDRENTNEIPDNSSYKNLTSYSGSSEILVFINDSSKGVNKSYTIAFETEDGEEMPTENDLIEITFDKLGSYMMNITVKNDISGCSASTQLGPIKVEEIYLDVPNVFTPDGDGINDKFMAVYSSIKEFKMIIFNRWGRKVFQTTDPGEAWDGKIAGKKAAEGVYFYVITAEGYNKGESRKMEGPVHLLRGQ